MEVDSTNTNIILKARYPGVESNEMFAFTVAIFNEDNSLVSPYPISYYGTNDTRVDIKVTAAGTYTITVMSENPYGASDGISVPFIMEQSKMPTSSPNTTSQSGMKKSILKF